MSSSLWAAGGAQSQTYELPILSAQMVVGGVRESVEFNKNVFRAVKLVEGQITRLEIELGAGHRYRLDVK